MSLLTRLLLNLSPMRYKRLMFRATEERSRNTRFLLSAFLIFRPNRVLHRRSHYMINDCATADTPCTFNPSLPGRQTFSD